MRLRKTALQGILSAVAALALLLAAGAASAKGDKDEFVAKAVTAFDDFSRDPEMTWFQEHVGEARAVLIAPEVVKAGFILGGSGGRAAMLARDPKTGKWTGPAFYTLATGSIGFQAGVQVSQTIALIMNDKAFNSLLEHEVRLGGDTSVAAGPVGAGAHKDVAADIVTFSRAKGLYGGLNLDGSLVKASKEWNKDFYHDQDDVTPARILVDGSVSNDRGEKLRTEVSEVASKKHPRE